MTKHKYIEVQSSNLSGIFQILANKGICWQVLDEETGDSFSVQKKHVVRGPWEEEVLDEAEQKELEGRESSHASPLTQALEQIKGSTPATPKPKKEKPAATERDPDLVTLKQLCFDLDIVPRIARRKLRKALGNIGTGRRWEWSKDSADLAKVKAALATPVTEAETNADDAE